MEYLGMTLLMKYKYRENIRAHHIKIAQIWKQNNDVAGWGMCNAEEQR